MPGPCQATGPHISGNNLSDKTSDGCYVADFYFNTGMNGFATSKCPESGESSGKKLGR